MEITKIFKYMECQTIANNQLFSKIISKLIDEDSKSSYEIICNLPHIIEQNSNHIVANGKYFKKKLYITSL